MANNAPQRAKFYAKWILLPSIALGSAVGYYQFAHADKSLTQGQTDLIPRLTLPTVAIPLNKATSDIARDKLPVSVVVDLPKSLNTINDGVWSPLNGDKWHWQQTVYSVGAEGLSIGFQKLSLPPEAEIWVSAPDGSSRQGPYTGDMINPNGKLWTATVPGNELLIQVITPADDVASTQFELDAAQHVYVPFWKNHIEVNDTETGVPSNKVGSCNPHIACPVGDPWRPNASRAVGRIAYTSGGQGYVCSGTLLNNTNNDGKPYFYTAAHCIDTAEEAASAVIYWNFEATSCDGTGSTPYQNQSGAFLRATWGSSDFSLLELSQIPNPAFNVYYAGWDSTGNTPGNAVGLHHPGGSEKRISVENQALQPTGLGKYSTDGGATYWRVADWDTGTTEPGSSGSSLWNAQQRVVGQLSAGFAECSNNSSDWYGRLSSAWSGGGNASSQLAAWLDPKHSGNQRTWDGKNGSDTTPSDSGNNGNNSSTDLTQIVSTTTTPITNGQSAQNPGSGGSGGSGSSSGGDSGGSGGGGSGNDTSSAGNGSAGGGGADSLLLVMLLGGLAAGGTVSAKKTKPHEENTPKKTSHETALRPRKTISGTMLAQSTPDSRRCDASVQTKAKTGEESPGCKG